MTNVEEAKSVSERIDKNDNREFSQQEIKDFIFDKKNWQQNIKDLVNFLEESKQNRLDPYGKDKYFIDNFQNIMNLPEMSEMFTKIDEKINKNENLTNDEKSLIYLDAITVWKRRKNAYDMSSWWIIHREIFLKNSKTPFNPNDPTRKICDWEFLNYIRCCYWNQNYNPEQYSPIPDKWSTIQDNKNYIKDPVKFKQEKEKEKIKSEYEGLPQIPPISQRWNEYIHSYCNMIYKRAEDNWYLVMAEYESRLRNEFRSHVKYNENWEWEYVHDKEFDAYVRYDKLLFAFQKYCEVINKKHEQVIKEAWYHDIDEFSQEMKYFGLFQDLIKEKYPDLEEVLKRLEPYWTEMEENKNKYFSWKSDNDIENAWKNFAEFQEFQNKKNEEYWITNEMIESLNNIPNTKEEAENYFKNMDTILKFQCELNIKKWEYWWDIIDNYMNYILWMKDIQWKYQQIDFDTIKNYTTDLAQRWKDINFDRCSKYSSMIDRKWKYSQLWKDLENIWIISDVLNDPTGEYFPIFDVKNAETEKKLKQEKIDETRANIKRIAPEVYWTCTVFKWFWNWLVDSTIWVWTSLWAMITGLIWWKEHYQSQLQKKERVDNFFKFNQTTTQKQAVYDPQTGSLNFKWDNTVTTVSSSVAQMLCLIYWWSAVWKWITKLWTKTWIAIWENVVSKAWLFWMSFITQVWQSYWEAVNSGLDWQWAFLYSMLSASVQSWLELVSPNDVLLWKWTWLWKQLINSLCKNESWIKLVWTYFLKSVWREILEENLQEWLQLAAWNLVMEMANRVWDSNFEVDWNPKNFLSTAIITTLTTWITTGFSAWKQGLQILNSNQPQLMARIASDKELYEDVMNILDNSINWKIKISDIDVKTLQELKTTLSKIKINIKPEKFEIPLKDWKCEYVDIKTHKSPENITKEQAKECFFNWLDITAQLMEWQTNRSVLSSWSLFLNSPEFMKLGWDIDVATDEEVFRNVALKEWPNWKTRLEQYVEEKKIIDLKYTLIDHTEITIDGTIARRKNRKTNVEESAPVEDLMAKWDIRVEFNIPSKDWLLINCEFFPEPIWYWLIQLWTLRTEWKVNTYTINGREIKTVNEELAAMSYMINLAHEVDNNSIEWIQKWKKLKDSVRINNFIQYLSAIWLNTPQDIIEFIDKTKFDYLSQIWKTITTDQETWKTINMSEYLSKWLEWLDKIKKLLTNMKKDYEIKIESERENRWTETTITFNQFMAETYRLKKGLTEGSLSHRAFLEGIAILQSKIDISNPKNFAYYYEIYQMQKEFEEKIIQIERPRLDGENRNFITVRNLEQKDFQEVTESELYAQLEEIWNDLRDTYSSTNYDSFDLYMQLLKNRQDNWWTLQEAFQRLNLSKIDINKWTICTGMARLLQTELWNKWINAHMIRFQAWGTLNNEYLWEWHTALIIPSKMPDWTITYTLLDPWIQIPQPLVFRKIENNPIANVNWKTYQIIYTWNEEYPFTLKIEQSGKPTKMMPFNPDQVRINPEQTLNKEILRVFTDFKISKFNREWKVQAVLRLNIWTHWKEHSIEIRRRDENWNLHVFDGIKPEEFRNLKESERYEDFKKACEILWRDPQKMYEEMLLWLDNLNEYNSIIQSTQKKD